MGITNQMVAELLAELQGDRNRTYPGWWVRECPECGHIVRHSVRCLNKPSFDDQPWKYVGPSFRDPAHCERFVIPVLLKFSPYPGVDVVIRRSKGLTIVHFDGVRVLGSYLVIASAEDHQEACIQALAKLRPSLLQERRDREASKN